MTPLAAQKEAEHILAELAAYKKERARLQDKIGAEIAEVEKRYSREEERLKVAILTREAALLVIARGQSKTWFKNEDRRTLTNGVINYKITKVVVRARDMLERLKKHKLARLIIAGKPTPDWDEIDKLPDATLKEIGARRRSHESFGYEINPDEKKAEG